MKLRIKGNSVRLRLTKTEVDTLVNDREVWDVCHILHNHLKFGVKSFASNEISAQFIDKNLTVFLPEKLIVNWNKDERISFQKTDQNGLNILVEKDFKCLIDRPHEKEDDMYDNPARQK